MSRLDAREQRVAAALIVLSSELPAITDEYLAGMSPQRRQEVAEQLERLAAELRGEQESR